MNLSVCNDSAIQVLKWKFISSVLEQREQGEREREESEMQVDESGCSGLSSNFWNNSRSRTCTISTDKPKYFILCQCKQWDLSIKYTFSVHCNYMHKHLSVARDMILCLQQFGVLILRTFKLEVLKVLVLTPLLFCCECVCMWWLWMWWECICTDNMTVRFEWWDSGLGLWLMQ